MEKIRYGVVNAMVETTDIEHLPAEVLDQLDCGDFVIKVSGSEKHLYQVKYCDKVKNEIALVYCDYHSIEELYWEKAKVVGAMSLKKLETLTLN